jgi:hypothetical protein
MPSKNNQFNKYRLRRFTAEIYSVAAGKTRACITDKATGDRTWCDFILHRTGTLAYASAVVIDGKDKWVGENIDSISPVVCAAVCEFLERPRPTPTTADLASAAYKSVVSHAWVSEE